MIVRALRKRINIFFVIFFICPNESQSQPARLPVIKSASLGVAPNVLRDLNKPQFISRRSDLYEKLPPGFNLTDEEIKKFRLWEKGVVPFYIDVLSFSDKVLRDRIRLFLNEVNSLTPLNFVELPSPPTSQKTRWVFFVNRQGQLGCSDFPINNFTNEGVQRVVLGYDCMSGERLAATVLAIVGISPQHNAPNRNKYIKVVDKNIIPEKKYLFKKLSNKEWLFHDLNYDFHSAGHYDHHKHSANGRATIQLKKAHREKTFADQHGLSQVDIVKMILVYNYIVNKNKETLPACSKLFSPGKNIEKKKLYMVKPLPKPWKYSNDHAQSDSKSGTDADTKKLYSDNEDSRHFISVSSETSKNSISSESAGRNSQRIFNLSARNNTLDRSITKLKTYQDPLSYLSDYQTGDEALQRSAWRKNRDYYNFGKVGAYFKSV